MKRVSLILCLLLLLAAPLSAQPSANGRDDDRFSDLPPGLQRLELTEDQHQQVRQIMERQRATRQAMREKMKQDLASILTKEQLQQWETFRENRRGQRRDGRSGCPSDKVK